MNFTKRDAYHVASDCGLYVINKATVGIVGEPGTRLCYMAVHRGRDILGTWRCVDEPEARASAYREAVDACARHAAG